MSKQEVVKRAFIAACKYLQHNPPAEIFTPDEIMACAGCAFYEDGWKQWANFFIKQALLSEQNDGERTNS